MSIAYLSLGSNEGDREITLEKALVRIEQECGLILQQSSVYETAAWGLHDQPDFLNMAIRIETSMDAEALLREIQGIEAELHRERIVKWGQRTIDIDILFYDNYIIATDTLTIPHPMLKLRRFVLVPLAEIAPEFEYPLSGKSIKELLEECPDTLEVKNVSSTEN